MEAEPQKTVQSCRQYDVSIKKTKKSSEPLSSKRNIGQRRQHLKGGIVIMNLKDCYIRFGGDFDEVLSRLRREQSVQNLCISFWMIKAFICLKRLWRIRTMKRL